MRNPASLHGSAVGTAVASAVLRAFECLPKTGKPQVHEHTVLAGNSSIDAAAQLLLQSLMGST